MTTYPNYQEIKRLGVKYPIPRLSSSANTKTNTDTNLYYEYSYGTAGFRCNHQVLESVMLKVGLLAAWMSHSLNGEHVGVMVTASHNLEVDNGVKISYADGGMIPPIWEQRATEFANEPDICQIIRILQKTQLSSSTSCIIQQPVVHVGRDTRSHSPHLANLVCQAAQLMGAKVIHHGLITTPQLHWFVLASNPHRMFNISLASTTLGSLHTQYFQTIVGSYIALLQTQTLSPLHNNHSSSNSRSSRRTLLVDCACGVGGYKVQQIQSILHQQYQHFNLDHSSSATSSLSLPIPHILPFNLPGHGPLNEKCGAEYVQKQQSIPTIYSPSSSLEFKNHDIMMNQPYVASLDGDADRIVFYYTSTNTRQRVTTLHLLDGDKISVLLATFLQDELFHLYQYISESSSLRPHHDDISTSSIQCGVVQTAYANGASTFYLQNTLGMKIITTKTGVKFVHHAALHNFDVGIYFEANGHGTILFNAKFYDLMAIAEQLFLHPSSTVTTTDTSTNDCSKDNGLRPRALIAWQRLRILPRLINQAVGDALSDLLLVDAILYLKNWTLTSWNNLYHDLPSRQLKVYVQDRNIISTNDNETRVLKPIELQSALDNLVSSMISSSLSSSSSSAVSEANSNQSSSSITKHDPKVIMRTFVRPSGTENVVRIYAEAPTQKDADELATHAAALVYRFCGGVGDCPNLRSKI